MESNPSDVKSNEASSAKSPEQSGAQSESPEKDVKIQPQSLEDALEKVYDQHEPEQTTEESEEESGSSTEGEETTDKGAAEKETQPSEEEAKEGKTDDSKHEEAIPYERFKEVNDKYQELSAERESVKQEVQNYREINSFCQRHSITAEKFETLLKFAALSESDPTNALQVIKPMLDGIRESTGDVLPSDLAKKVEDGKMELEDAKEMARLRGSKTSMVARSQRERELAQQNAAQENQRQAFAAVSAWQEAKTKVNPDYKPKANATAADGLYEEVQEKFTAKMNAVGPEGQFLNPVRNITELTSLLDKCYTEVVSRRDGLRAKPATKKRLPSNGASTNSGKPKNFEEAKSLDEVAKMVFSKHGI